MTSLIEDLKNPPKPSFTEWLISRTPEERKALEAAAVDRRWTDSGLERLLRSGHGVSCSKETIRAWRASVSR